ncbi:MAG TPA: ATP-binding protein [Polyangiales bacterium]|nr:ATP-binding protein [Polyangiales bacterium]
MQKLIATSGDASGHIAADFLQRPAPRSHTVQFYEGERFLIDTLALYVGAGLRAGECVLAIITRAHSRALYARLEASGCSVQAALHSGTLVVHDAQHMLSQFMLGGMIDPGLFREQVARTLAGLHRPGSVPPPREVGSSPRGWPRVRAYGEMVDLLAREGNISAAIELEALWNDTCARHGFALLCTYAIDNFQGGEDHARFADVCARHSHVLPTEEFCELHDRAATLREISVLQQRARLAEHERRERKQLAAALLQVQSQKTLFEDELRAALWRERESRGRAESSQAFKEVFLGMLGHDLRNPLNTILTTLRVTLMQPELETELRRRLSRVLSSGERMSRMVEQILDATRARLSAGIPVRLSDGADLVPLIRETVAELRAAYPARDVELQLPATCVARIDPDRFEQVLSNLLGNAFAHGDPERRVRISVEIADETICVAVHNYGHTIEPEVARQLFDPWHRGPKPLVRSAGLGLGLYISQHVVRAHGGNITVESSASGGTRFEIRLPCP